MRRLWVLLLLRLMLRFPKAAVLLPLPLPMQLGHSLKAVPPMLLKAVLLMLLMLPNVALALGLQSGVGPPFRWIQ